MGRSLNREVTEAVLAAAVTLLRERSFASVSMAAIAERAGVGKPALYRRFAGKEELMAAAIATLLPAMTPPAAASSQDPRERLRGLLEQALPADPAGYAALMGDLMAEHRRHPELINAFRTRVLLPRRAMVEDAIADAQRAGRLRADLLPELGVDMLGGAFLARAFAGLEMDERWLTDMFDAWWALASPQPRPINPAGG